MIRRFKLFLTAALLLPMALLSGCLSLSVHPLYTGKHVVFDPSLLGDWAEPTTHETWNVTRAGQDHYQVVYTEQNRKDEDRKRGEFVARLVRVKGALFLDLFPAETESPQGLLYASHFLPTHSLFQVIRTQPTPQLAELSDDWLRKFVAGHPSAIRHETISGYVLLTASPHELQRFLAAHVTTKGAFVPDAPWKRQALPASERLNPPRALNARQQRSEGAP